MPTDKTNSGADRTGDTGSPPSQASDESAESKKKNNNSSNKSNCIIYQGQIKDGVMNGVVISSGTSTQIMTTDYRLFTTLLISYAASKGYKRWPGVLENMELLMTNIWDITQPDKTQYATIMTTEVSVTNCAKVQKKEWVVMNCAKEFDLEDNYNN